MAKKQEGKENSNLFKESTKEKTKGKQKELVVRKFTLRSKFKRVDFESGKSLIQ